jgi:hypothetical protein
VTALNTALRQLDAYFKDANVLFALVGGLAVSVRSEPRFTRDADLAVAVASDSEAEALIRNLPASQFRIGAVIEHAAVGRLATVRLTPAEAVEDQSPVVDLLFASSGIEPEIVADAEPVELLPGLTVGVARTSHLIALKVLARDDIKRPLDIADLRALLSVASPADLAHVRELLDLITARGYHRGRNLLADFDSLLPRS